MTTAGGFCSACGAPTFFAHPEVPGAPMVEIDARPDPAGTIRLHGDPRSASQRPQMETLGPLELASIVDEELYTVHACAALEEAS